MNCGDYLDDCININNIANLFDKTPDKVVAFLKERFLNKKINTWVGQALVIINPHENCEKTSSEANKEAPSIKALISRILLKQSTKLEKSGQCIVISGDSGAGKTHSAYTALKYLAKNDSDCLISKIRLSIPLLAAFGNASTVHNSNSSRFGKLIQLQYNKNGKIASAHIQTYLLEKSRIEGPNLDESNFHIFHQILQYFDEMVLSDVYLSRTSNYKILPEISNVENAINCKEMLNAMKLLEIVEIGAILKVLATILNLGNIEFYEHDGQYSLITETKTFLENCSKLLECKENDLISLFTKRLIAGKFRRFSVYHAWCLNLEECENRRNCFMKFLYEKLFFWLIKRINEQLLLGKKTSPSDSDNCRLLGILDIYGFEVFKTNKFEQLCINYANERLQQFFVQNYLNKQLVYLQEEGFKTETDLNQSEYDERLNLLDGDTSLFGILNEECLMKRYNSDAFISARLSYTFKTYSHFIKRYNSLTFTIRHYAGNVEYDCKAMVSKNRDKIPEEFVTFLQRCKFDGFLHDILVQVQEEEKGSSSNNNNNNNNNKGRTLLEKFKKSLDNLMANLQGTDVHYIKCLKANSLKQSRLFDDDFVLDQLRFNGILEILKLEFQGYSIRMSKKEFEANFSSYTRRFFEKEFNNKQIYFGLNNVFFSEKFIVFSKIQRKIAATKIQNNWRSYYRCNEAAKKIQKFYKMAMKRKELAAIATKKPRTLAVFNRSDHIVSHFKIIEIPIRFHIKKTCLPYSHKLPNSELPQGLTDIF